MLHDWYQILILPLTCLVGSKGSQSSALGMPPPHIRRLRNTYLNLDRWVVLRKDTACTYIIKYFFLNKIHVGARVHIPDILEKNGAVWAGAV